MALPERAVLFYTKKRGDYVKLKDRERKKIIAEYASSGVSQRDLAKKYHVTQKTISTILNDKRAYEKIAEIEEENTLSMLAFLESKRCIAQSLISVAMDSIRDKIKNASVRDLAGLIKTLVETFRPSESVYQEEGKATVIINLKDTSGECND